MKESEHEHYCDSDDWNIKLDSKSMIINFLWGSFAVMGMLAEMSLIFGIFWFMIGCPSCN